MAFSYTINDNGVPEFMGGKKVISGTFTNTGNSTGGNITVDPLRRIDFFNIQATNSSTANSNSVTETFPMATNVVTIATAAGVDGIWYAIGE